jgi:hypothetical protein
MLRTAKVDKVPRTTILLSNDAITNTTPASMQISRFLAMAARALASRRLLSIVIVVLFISSSSHLEETVDW